MTGRFARVTAWLAAGGSALAGLYWLLLNTPESNVTMVGASLVLALVLVAGAALVTSVAILMSQGLTLRTAVGRGLRNIHWFVVVAALASGAWWAVASAEAWIARHAGEINAWFIAALGWADVSWLLWAVSWLTLWVRGVIVPLTALAVLAALLQGGRSVLTRADWPRAAWGWRRLLTATLVVGLLLVLPWRLTTWRPELPSTWVQPAAAALRLGVVALLACVGCALLLRTVTAPRRKQKLASTPGEST